MGFLILLIPFAFGIVAYQFLRLFGHAIGWAIFAVFVLMYWSPPIGFSVALAAYLVSSYFDGHLKRDLAILSLVAGAVGVSAVMMANP